MGPATSRALTVKRSAKTHLVRLAVIYLVCLLVVSVSRPRGADEERVSWGVRLPPPGSDINTRHSRVSV